VRRERGVGRRISKAEQTRVVDWNKTPKGTGGRGCLFSHSQACALGRTTAGGGTWKSILRDPLPCSSSHCLLELARGFRQHSSAGCSSWGAHTRCRPLPPRGVTLARVLTTQPSAAPLPLWQLRGLTAPFLPGPCPTSRHAGRGDDKATRTYAWRLA